MNWTTLADLKTQLIRRWERGDLLRHLADAESVFPLRLAVKTPNSNDITERFESVRTWAAMLSAQAHIRVGMREVRHRVQGAQYLPDDVWIDSLEDALALLGKRRDADRFARVVAATRAGAGALIPWLQRHPLQALALADDWLRLLAVLAWLEAHPRPGIYLRQIDVPGIHTKFIEGHRAVLAELFDLALPPEHIRSGASGVGQFAQRYGFLDKPARIRFRPLDDSLRLIAAECCPDVTLDADSFALLRLPIKRVFITENETNFLAFPQMPQSIVVFGAGYGWEPLSRAHWLRQCVLHYWGDIDTHGFAILDQLRGHFTHVQSLLMDSATLERHEQHWGVESTPSRVDLLKLSPQERALYDDLRDNRIRENLRLEQERVEFGWVRQVLGRLDAIA